MPVASPRIPLASVLHLRHLASSRYRSAAGRFSSTGHRRSLAITRAVKSSLPRFLGSSSRLPVQLPTASPRVRSQWGIISSEQADLLLALLWLAPNHILFSTLIAADLPSRDNTKMTHVFNGRTRELWHLRWRDDHLLIADIQSPAPPCYETTQGGCGGMVDNASTKAVLEGMTKANTEGDSSTRCWRAACIIVVYHAWMFQEHLVNCG
uniref:Uncharacterized protein n=1 Tax=Oryza glumipatula TaxID=40148 RepID=A0A0E0BL98_9ORYZ